MIQVVLSDDPPALDDLSVPRVYLYPEEPGDPYTVHSWRDLTGAFALPPVLLGDDGVEVPTDLLKVAPQGTDYEAGERRAPPLPPHLHDKLRAALDQLKVGPLPASLPDQLRSALRNLPTSAEELEAVARADDIKQEDDIKQAEDIKQADAAEDSNQADDIKQAVAAEDSNQADDIKQADAAEDSKQQADDIKEADAAEDSKPADDDIKQAVAAEDSKQADDIKEAEEEDGIKQAVAAVADDIKPDHDSVGDDDIEDQDGIKQAVADDIKLPHDSKQNDDMEEEDGIKPADDLDDQEQQQEHKVVAGAGVMVAPPPRRVRGVHVPPRPKNHSAGTGGTGDDVNADDANDQHIDADGDGATWDWNDWEDWCYDYMSAWDWSDWDWSDWYYDWDYDKASGGGDGYYDWGTTSPQTHHASSDCHGGRASSDDAYGVGGCDVDKSNSNSNAEIYDGPGKWLFIGNSTFGDGRKGMDASTVTLNQAVGDSKGDDDDDAEDFDDRWSGVWIEIPLPAPAVEMKRTRNTKRPRPPSYPPPQHLLKAANNVRKLMRP